MSCSMADRVARAAFDAVQQHGLGGMDWGDVGRAIIEEMRHPTDEVWHAGCTAPIANDVPALAIWSAMIDAALK